MAEDPKLLEEKAHAAISEDKFEEAFKSFKEAASFYQAQDKHKQAALCFAAAAGCWSKKCGESAFYNSALSYQEAAKESSACGDLEYASVLYKYAAINYEKDGEFLNFSDCFYNAKESYRRFLNRIFTNPKGIHHIVKISHERGIKYKLKHFFPWLAFTFSYLVWGYGERPIRTLVCAIVIIFLSTFFYTGFSLIRAGVLFQPNFFEAFYFSMVTFTTVGYGDIIPIGLSKLVVIIEAFCGVFIMPIFIVGLSRKYLRI